MAKGIEQVPLSERLLRGYSGLEDFTSGQVRRPVAELVLPLTYERSVKFELKMGSRGFMLFMAPVYIGTSRETGIMRLADKAWQVADPGNEECHVWPNGFGWQSPRIIDWNPDTNPKRAKILVKASEREKGWDTKYMADGRYHQTHVDFPNVVRLVAGSRDWDLDEFGLLQKSDFSVLIPREFIEVTYSVYWMYWRNRNLGEGDRTRYELRFLGIGDGSAFCPLAKKLVTTPERVIEPVHA